MDLIHVNLKKLDVKFMIKIKKIVLLVCLDIKWILP
jgi:hypothetical protein